MAAQKIAQFVWRANLNHRANRKHVSFRFGGKNSVCETAHETHKDSCAFGFEMAVKHAIAIFTGCPIVAAQVMAKLMANGKNLLAKRQIAIHSDVLWLVAIVQKTCDVIGEVRKNQDFEAIVFRQFKHGMYFDG